MKILVTGAAGFIGFHLCYALLEEDVEVIGLDNINNYYDISLKYERLNKLGVKREKAKEWNQPVKSNLYTHFTFTRINLEDRITLPLLFEQEKFDIVVNLAAQAGVRYSLENPNSYIDSNIVGFFNILECCRHNNIKHLVYASSSSVYGENTKVPFSENDRVDYPVSLYAATKKSNELMAYSYSHLYNIPTSGLRFFTVYGPWGRPDMAPMLFTDAIMNDKRIKVFNNGNMERDFTYIDDVVKGIKSIINKGPDLNNEQPYYRILNIGNSKPVKLIDFISILETELGKKAIKDMRPMQPGDVPKTFADISRLEKLLTYKPQTSLQEGIKKFVDWWKNYYINISNI